MNPSSFIIIYMVVSQCVQTLILLYVSLVIDKLKHGQDSANNGRKAKKNLPRNTKHLPDD